MFAALAEAEPGTFYLTDFLLRHFERLVLAGLGLDRHPELFPAYFGNYRKLVYLAQAPKPDALERGAAPSRRAWGSHSSIVETGYGDLETMLESAVRRDGRRGEQSRATQEARRMASLIIISWRDIPAQVIVKRGRETAKVQLSQRFQEAVDRAAMRAGKGSSDAYLADWQRSAPRPCGEDLQGRGGRRGRDASRRSSPTRISSG